MLLKTRSLSSAAVKRGRSRIRHVQRRRYFAQRVRDHLALRRERAGEPVQRVDGGDDPVALLIQHPDEFVEPGQQFTHVVLMTRQRRAEVVDDVADLAQATGIQHDRQRRQGLLGRRIRRRPVQRNGGPGREASLWPLTERRIELHVHRTQQAGLPDGGHRVRRHHGIGFDRDLDVGVVALDSHLADAAHR